ncbi:hypothetical protein [Corynebacterium auriscanis]|uniref:hypothetical protein n=2 Tax=Corynebacterium auriscanis TaxID=99807 RepID=UPI003CF2ABAB
MLDLTKGMGSDFEFTYSNGREQLSLAERGVDSLSYWVAKQFAVQAGLLDTPEPRDYHLNRMQESIMRADRLRAYREGTPRRVEKLQRKAMFLGRLWVQSLKENALADRKPQQLRWVSANDFFQYKEPNMATAPGAVEGELVTGREAGIERRFLTIEQAAKTFHVTPEHVRDVYLKWDAVEHFNPRDRKLIVRAVKNSGLNLSELTGEAHSFSGISPSKFSPAMSFSYELYVIFRMTRRNWDYLEEIAEISEREHVYDFERYLDETGEWKGAAVTALRNADGSAIKGEDSRFLSAVRPVSYRKKVLEKKAYSAERLEAAHRAAQRNKGANRAQARGKSGRFVKAT